MPAKKYSFSGGDVVKWVAVFLTSISLLGGTMAWGADQLNSVEKDVKADIEDNYTKKEDFARIEERMISQEKQLDSMNKKLDSILNKIHDR